MALVDTSTLWTHFQRYVCADSVPVLTGWGNLSTALVDSLGWHGTGQATLHW